MPAGSTTLVEQFQTAMASVSTADIDLFSRMLIDPQALTPNDQKNVAQKLGMKGPFLEFAVNTVSDPVVWLSFWMSKRFPALAYLKGAIPTRFIGAANDFTGLSVFTRPVSDFFRGTTVPRLVALAETRKAKVLGIGNRMFRRMERPDWLNEKEAVSLLMEGQAVPASAELHTLARQLRGDMEELWGFLKETKKITGGFEGTRITKAIVGDFPAHQAPRYLRDFIPHIPLLGDEDVIRVSGREAIRRLSRNRLSQAAQAIGEDVGAVWSLDQQGTLVSNFARYQQFLNKTQGQVFNSHLMRRSRHNIPIASERGQELFVSDLDVVLQKYVHAVARTYAINAPISPLERALASARVIGDDGVERFVTPTNEPIIAQIINVGLGHSGMKVRRRPVLGTRRVSGEPAFDEEFSGGNSMMQVALRDLVRSVSGMKDEGEIMFGNMFSAMRRRFDTLQKNIFPGQRDRANELISSFERTRDDRTVLNGITSFFYSTTLGLNPWSAIQNLTQPIITTGPAIGIGPMFQGMRELGRLIPQYVREMQIQHRMIRRAGRPALEGLNSAAERAFEKTFPGLVRSGIKLDPRLFDIDPVGVSSFGPRGRKAFKSYDEYAKFILQPFTQAELSNQATTFFGARSRLRQAIRTGEFEVPRLPDNRPLVGRNLDAYLDFQAGEIVNATQFRPGPGQRSILQSRLPAPLRMFTSFPSRMLSLMGESTVKGALTAKQLETASFLERLTGGRNLGLLSRRLLMGRIAANGARDVLGLDLSGALGITDTFNVAPQGQPFAPFPVPPIATTVFGIVSATTTRDIKRLSPLILPGIGPIPLPRTLIPGGVGLSKMARALNQFRPDLGGFVDDDQRLMYEAGTYDHIMSLLGIPLEKSRRMRDAVERVQSVRERVRRIRRDATIGIVNADPKAINAAKAKWAGAFPDWPPLTISRRDVDRYRDNARIPLLQRMVQTMGSTGRFLHAELYDLDPELIGPPPNQLFGPGGQ